MSERGKKIFLGLSITVPFLLYCVYYYGSIIRNAPYKYAEFQSIAFCYGPTGKENEYLSKVGNYRYRTETGVSVVKKVLLNKNDLLYIHRKAAILGFWNFPEAMLLKQHKGNRFYVQLAYKRKTKTVYFDSDWNDNPKIADAMKQLIATIQQTLNEAELR